MPIKKKDFIELEYTGRLKENNLIFDTTDEKVAKENNIFSKEKTYHPIVICVGEGHILNGIDKNIEGKEFGKYKIDLSAEDAFGKKDPKLMQLIQTNKFLQQGIRPVPGLQINMDGIIGTVRSVSGGRTIMDFNHPLAGKDIIYEVKINKFITDAKEKITAVLQRLLNLDHVHVDLKDGKTKIGLHNNLPDEITKELSKKIIELCEVKEVEFSVEEHSKEEHSNPKKDNVKQ